jgi:integrase
VSSAAAPRKDPKSGTWWFVVDLPARGDGRRRQAKRRGFPTKAAAQAALDDLRVRTRTGTYVAPARQTFGEFLTQDWLPAIRTTVEPSTHESYTRNLTLHVIPRIGGIGLQQLDAGVLNRLYAELIEHGRLDSKQGGLSGRTVRYIHTIIGRALREAVAWDRVPRNVARAAQPPSTAQARSPEMHTWDGPTVARFLDHVRDDRHYAAWLFLVTTGCRRGEALGLRWQDVDLDTGKVVLRQTVTAIRHEVRIAPRTKTGKPRPVELDGSTVLVLRGVRARQARERLLLGSAYTDNDLVFARPDGQPQHPEHFSMAFDRRVARYRLPRIRLHDLRHTWATLALSAGVDVKIVSERLGHASAKITWDIYQHVTPTMQSNAAETVARLIFGPAE